MLGETTFSRRFLLLNPPIYGIVKVGKFRQNPIGAVVHDSKK